MGKSTDDPRPTTHQGTARRSPRARRDERRCRRTADAAAAIARVKSAEAEFRAAQADMDAIELCKKTARVSPTVSVRLVIKPTLGKNEVKTQRE